MRIRECDGCSGDDHGPTRDLAVLEAFERRRKVLEVDALAYLGPGLVWLPALLAGAALAHRGFRSVDRRIKREGDRC